MLNRRLQAIEKKLAAMPRCGEYLARQIDRMTVAEGATLIKSLSDDELKNLVSFYDEKPSDPERPLAIFLQSLSEAEFEMVVTIMPESCWYLPEQEMVEVLKQVVALGFLPDSLKAKLGKKVPAR